ncbi:Hypothetical protein SRAE_2000407400 [Strongyloides ratti]|uniref:Matrix-remodeling-associated protein 7 helical domain-containing protein n=1 Tax=Strongyloides ratti TaxID=34506 RepID=A0A090LPF9_STRRB|nr:Hypothetical protein SRAE_2000407400 [Strongyloides ratti]CEF69425.1 Hypothetical protein SRAE_2000407400 [Strongyloides ratti]
MISKTNYSIIDKLFGYIKMDFFKITQEPYFFTILFLTFIAAVAIKKIVVRKNPDHLLKGNFNRNIQFVNKKKNNKNKEKEVKEKNNEEDIKTIEIEEKVEENDLTESEENKLTTDILINDIVDPNETINMFSKIGELHGKLATAKTRIEARNFQKSLTEQERKEEENIKEKQLKEIFEMLQAQEEKFGIHSKSELEEQFKFYAL